MADVPESHWNFLEHQCLDYFETDSHLFVHGGVIPHLQMDVQPTSFLYWQPFPPGIGHISGKVMICGHTPQKDGLPRSVGHAICIDTGSGIGGPLTALDVNNRSYWQATDANFVGAKNLNELQQNP